MHRQCCPPGMLTGQQESHERLPAYNRWHQLCLAHGDGVGCAAVSGDNVFQLALPTFCSGLTAHLLAILDATDTMSEFLYNI